jgi:two-component sensor histidine kinase
MPKSTILSLVRWWALSFVVFGLLALASVGQLGMTRSLPIGELLNIAVRDWLYWAMVAPIVFLFVYRLPIDRENWKRAVPVHIILGVVLILLGNVWADNLVGNRMGLPPDMNGGPPLGQGGFGPKFGGPGEKKDVFGPGPKMEGFGPGPGRSGPGGKPMRSPFFIGFRLPFYLGILSVAHAALYSRKARERERKSLELQTSLAKARLDALKTQLQPHFLFNALNAIASLVHENPDKADEMLVALSDLLRRTLDVSGDQELPLKGELELVERYLSIERVRFGKRLRVELNVQPETEKAMVPALMLQPLVENAIKHGLESRPEAGLVKIVVRREGDDVILSVADDGAGLAEPIKEGIGISNTKARLRELYGENAELNLKNCGGLVVEVRIPFRSAS